MRPELPLRDVRREQVKEDPVGAFITRLNDAWANLAFVEPSTADFSYLSIEQRAESLWATFQDVKRFLSGRKTKTREWTLADTKNFKIRVAYLKALYDDEEVREIYLGASETFLAEIDSINGEYEKYQALKRRMELGEATVDASAKDLFSRRGMTDECDRLAYEIAQRSLEENQKKIGELTKNNPKLAALVQYETLVAGAKELRETGFAWPSSRLKLLNQIRDVLMSGTPIFLFGESGTGKSDLAEHAIKKLTGRIAIQTKGMKSSLDRMIAEKGVDADGTFFCYVELGRAITGRESSRDTEPTDEGGVVLEEEPNLKDPDALKAEMAFIAKLKPGQEIILPLTGEKVTVMPKFGWIGALNYARAKYVGKELPAEVLRKGRPIDVPYLEQTRENPEIYETMLKSLIDENGRLRVPVESIAPAYCFKEEMRKVKQKDASGAEHTVDATVKVRELDEEEIESGGIKRKMPKGGFLWRLSFALDQLNKSISGQDTVLVSRGKEQQALRKLIIDIGKIRSWLIEYQTVHRTEDLERFLIQHIRDEFINQESLPLEDRKLATDFFKYFGIDLSKEPSPIQVPRAFKPMTALEMGLLSPRVHFEEILKAESVATSSYYMTPEGKRVDYWTRPYIENGKTIYSPGEVYFDIKSKRQLEYLGINKRSGEVIFAEAIKRSETPNPPSPPELPPTQFRLEGIEATKKLFPLKDGQPVLPDPTTWEKNDICKEYGLDDVWKDPNNITNGYNENRPLSDFALLEEDLETSGITDLNERTRLLKELEHQEGESIGEIFDISEVIKQKKLTDPSHPDSLTTKEVIEAIDQAGYRLGTLADLLTFGKNHWKPEPEDPTKPLSKEEKDKRFNAPYIFALGSVFSGFRGRRSVPYLSWPGDKRRLDAGVLGDDWYAFNRFLVFRKGSS